jgi:hypothetical protein
MSGTRKKTIYDPAVAWCVVSHIVCRDPHLCVFSLVHSRQVGCSILDIARISNNLGRSFGLGGDLPFAVVVIDIACSGP